MTLQDRACQGSREQKPVCCHRASVHVVLVGEEHRGEEPVLTKHEGPLKPEFRCLAEMEGEAETARTEGGPPDRPRSHAPGRPSCRCSCQIF